MKIKTVNITRSTRALINNAHVDASRGIVSWGRDDEVRFSNKDGRLCLERATAGMSFQTVFLSTEWKDFTADQQELIIAAVMCTGHTSVIIASQILQIEAVILEVVHLESQPRHATSWKHAQEFALSGHKKEEPKVTLTLPSRTVKVKLEGKPAVIVAAGLTLLTLGLLALGR
jgi:hypothetical protein